LLIHYLLLCNHARDLLEIRVPQPDDDDTGLLIKYLTLREVRIEQMLRRVRPVALRKQPNSLLGENTEITENSDYYTEPDEVMSLINSVKAITAYMNKGD
jgi:hypothetical protein